MNLLPSSKPAHNEHWTLHSQQFDVSYSETSSDSVPLKLWVMCAHLLARINHPEKEMATHSSVLAWRIPGTGEPGGLPSMGLHRVGHNWSDLAAAAAQSTPPWYPNTIMRQSIRDNFKMPRTFSYYNHVVLNIWPHIITILLLALRFKPEIPFNSNLVNKFLGSLLRASMLSHVQLFVTPWAEAHLASLSMEFSILEWVAISTSRGSSWPRDRTLVSHVSCFAVRAFTTEPPGKPYSPLPPMQPHFSFSSSKIRELLPLLAHSKVSTISSGGFHQEKLWTRDESHLSYGEEYPKQKGEHRGGREESIWLWAQRKCSARIFRDIKIKGERCEEGKKELRLCLPHPRYLWSAFRMLLSHSKMLKPIYLWLHF